MDQNERRVSRTDNSKEEREKLLAHLLVLEQCVDRGLSVGAYRIAELPVILNSLQSLKDHIDKVRL